MSQNFFYTLFLSFVTTSISVFLMKIFSIFSVPMVNMYLWLFCSLFIMKWLCIFKKKIDIEKGKLSDNISKLEKQITKEKKLIRRGRTKGLIKEHEVNNLISFTFCHRFGVYPK